MDAQDMIRVLRNAQKRTRLTQDSIDQYIPPDLDLSIGKLEEKSYYLNKDILEALRKISDSLAESYLQVIADFEDERRIKWGGTAHEIRELLRNLLDALAPDSNVRSQSWYKQQPNTSGPTQKQRVRYIIDVNNGDSRKHKAAQNVDIIDDKVADLVRDTYGRASDAAHRSKNKAEAFKILRYFEAFAYDLLGI